MSAHRATTALFLVLACATMVFARSYNNPNIVVSLPERGEAQAGAISDVAGASAAASRLNKVNLNRVAAYGYEIGKPLLANPLPPISNLYAAALPPRSLVARIEPVFRTDGYGKIIFNGESTMAVVAV